MSKYTVTFNELVRACRKAYEEKRLGAQLPYADTDGRCLYVYPKRPECGCAIGVGLPPKMREDLQDDSKIRFYNGKRIDIFMEEDTSALRIIGSETKIHALRKLQVAHDDWTPHKEYALSEDKAYYAYCGQKFASMLAKCEELMEAADTVT